LHNSVSSPSIQQAPTVNQKGKKENVRTKEEQFGHVEKRKCTKRSEGKGRLKNIRYEERIHVL
jgi:hypothetical protein